MARWRVREIAEPQRWNAHSLSLAAGLSYNTVYGIWHNTAKRADLETIEALCRVLQITPNELIELTLDDQSASRT